MVWKNGLGILESKFYISENNKIITIRSLMNFLINKFPRTNCEAFSISLAFFGSFPIKYPNLQQKWVKIGGLDRQTDIHLLVGRCQTNCCPCIKQEKCCVSEIVQNITFVSFASTCGGRDPTFSFISHLYDNVGYLSAQRKYYQSRWNLIFIWVPRLFNLQRSSSDLIFNFR